MRISLRGLQSLCDANLYRKTERENSKNVQFCNFFKYFANMDVIVGVYIVMDELSYM